MIAGSIFAAQDVRTLAPFFAGSMRESRRKGLCIGYVADSRFGTLPHSPP